MRYLATLFLMFMAMSFTFNCGAEEAKSTPREVIQKKHDEILMDHHKWHQDHKHENVDAFYYWRIGYLDACNMALDALDE